MFFITTIHSLDGKERQLTTVSTVAANLMEAIMDLEHKAIKRLKYASETSLAHYEKPLLITYSGGKDSDVLLELALRANIPMEVVHSYTTADAPQTVQYVRQKLRGLELCGIPVSITYPMYKGKRESLWSLIPIKGVPTRLMRWCCKICKEGNNKSRTVATGVRWAESTNRKNSRGPVESLGKTKKDKIILFDDDTENKQMALSDMVIINGDNDARRRWMEHCQMRGEICFNPIIDWQDSDVWAFLAGREVNPLYQMGFDRVGCIGCPMSGKSRYHQFRLFPDYKQFWKRAMEKHLQYRAARGKENIGIWKNIESYWAWWMGENPDQLFVEEWET